MIEDPYLWQMDSDPDPQHWNNSLLYHEQSEVLDFESETMTEHYMPSKQGDPNISIPDPDPH